MCRPGNRGKWEGSWLFFSRGEARCSARRRKRDCASGVNGHPESSNGDDILFYFFCSTFGEKRMKIRKGEIDFYIFLSDLLGLCTKQYAV